MHEPLPLLSPPRQGLGPALSSPPHFPAGSQCWEALGGGADFFLAQKVARGVWKNSPNPKLQGSGAAGGEGPPASLLAQPQPLAVFTVVAIKCQLLGVKNNKQCNSAQSKHPLSV